MLSLKNSFLLMKLESFQFLSNKRIYLTRYDRIVFQCRTPLRQKSCLLATSARKGFTNYRGKISLEMCRDHQLQFLFKYNFPSQFTRS